MIFLAYIELLLFAICAFTVFYLLVYAIAATGNRTDKYSAFMIKTISYCPSCNCDMAALTDFIFELFLK